MSLASTASLEAAARFDPRLRFRTLTTAHFVIYFHQGEERLAARLARIAEETRRQLQPTLGVPVQARTHVVLADQSELANGWAFPTPYNVIALNTASPSGSELIGNTEDWLRLVFAHEYAHIVHLDRSRGWSRVVRAVFGRAPLAFPNLLLPVWQIEGLATFEESRLTSAGRLHAGNFLAIEREAARSGALEPLDRLNGGLTSWPNGHAPYAYGGGFFEYLADAHGSEKLGQLSDGTTRRVPYFTAGTFSKVYGRSLDALWKDYRDALRAAPARDQTATTIDRLTHHGFDVVGPRFLPRGCPTCPWEIAYSARTPHAFPTLNTVALDGSAPRELTTRYLGSTTGVGRNRLIFDQQEIRRAVGLYSDLYSFDLGTGDVTQLTNDERLVDPDLSADGSTIVAVREGLGRRELVVVSAPQVTTILSEPDTQFNAPRWSPDGSLIAVERRRLGAPSEIVIVERQTKNVRVVAAAADVRYVTPAWRPDGRAVIVGAARQDEPFNLYEIDFEGSTPTRRQLTDTTGGAAWPDVSPDGSTIVFVGYTVDGFDLFAIPYPTNPSTTVFESVSTSAPETTPADADGVAAVRPYNPLATLVPTSWEPVIETDDDRLRVGVGIGGFDVLGYHAYSATATWRIDSPDYTGGSAPQLDWTLAYAYDRWVPTFFTTATWETSFAAVALDGMPRPSVIPVRSREFEAGATVPFRRVRMSHQALASILRNVDDYEIAGRPLSFNWTAARAGWLTSSAKRFGFSISPETGVSIGGTAEAVLEGLGSSASASAITGDVRAYVPGAGAHHVVALRAAAGASEGDRAARRLFLLGGASPAASVIDFDADAISLLRGFEPNAFAGTRVALINAEYRWPFARPQRGYRLWPVFLHTAHASVFADAGHAWSDEFETADIKTSLGAELSADIVAGYQWRFTVTAGAAWGHDGERQRDRATAYLRIGQAF